MSGYEYVCGDRLALVLAWAEDRLSAMALSWRGPDTACAATTPSGLALAEALMRYERGEAVTWPELPLDFESVSGFRADVLRTLLTQVPWGRVVTYGRLAAMAGRPLAARAVGRIMATNPWPLVVP